MEHRSPDVALAALQRRRFGVASVEEAIAIGVPGSTMHERVAAGRYLRLWPGVVQVAGAPESWEARALGAVLHVGGEAALSYWSAARVLGITAAAGARSVHVTVRVRVFPATSGIVVHRTRQLPADDVDRGGPIPVTTATRTLADLAGECGPVLLRRLLGSAVRVGLTDATALRGHLRRRGRLRGKRSLLQLVDVLSPLDADCRSRAEARFLRLMRGAALTPTAINHEVRDVTGARRVIDAVWLPEHLPVEVDSEHFHGSPIARDDDRRRERAIRLAGPWRPFVRVHEDDLVDRPGDVVQRVRDALAAARAHLIIE